MPTVSDLLGGISRAALADSPVESILATQDGDCPAQDRAIHDIGPVCECTRHTRHETSAWHEEQVVFEGRTSGGDRGAAEPEID